MTELVLERTFDPPRTPEEVRRQGRDGNWCFEAYRVRWLGSFLSSDGHAVVCRFSAPDAESTRIALRRLGADTRLLWPASIVEGPNRGPPNVLVRRVFPEPVTFEDVQEQENAAAACLRMHRVKFVRTFFSLDRRRMVCFYQAPDAEAVRVVQREAALPFEAIWAFQPVTLDA
ncbi:MAG TPA: DUF4242 domain-containing protein [Steroidobacter sp.]